MPDLYIRKSDSKAVHFEGAGDYLFVKNIGVWVKAKCQQVEDYETKKGCPLVHLTAKDVKKFDYCG